jgi:hypothetical protein
VAGVELAPRKGVVLGYQGEANEYLVVWFRGMGELCSDEAGHAIQAILATKAEVVGNVADLVTASIKRLAKVVYRADYASARPLFNELYRLGRERGLA